VNRYQLRPLYLGEVFPVYSCQLRGPFQCPGFERVTHDVTPGDYEITWIGGSWIRIERVDRPGGGFYEVGYDFASMIRCANHEMLSMTLAIDELFPYRLDNTQAQNNLAAEIIEQVAIKLPRETTED